MWLSGAISALGLMFKVEGIFLTEKPELPPKKFIDL